jgi:hypothetical protein
VKKIATLVFAVFALLLVMVYVALTTFSDRREYDSVSLDFYLLTPKELSMISKYCENTPRFIYSSADGTKPAIIHLHCLFERKAATDYLINNEFNELSLNRFRRNDIEIEFELDKTDNSKVAIATAFEYL